MLSKVKSFLLDVLFPVGCISCNKPDDWLCDKCLAKIPLKMEQFCPFCEKNITPDGRVCFSCRKKSNLEGLLVASTYQNKVITNAVHYFKYRFIEGLSEPLGEIMLKAFWDSGISLPDAIIPVPLHKKRLRWRGFNQAGLLAIYLGDNLAPGLKIAVLHETLVRNRYTYPQMEIKDYPRRKNNIAKAFGVKNKASIKGKSIILVDDVATTGSTLFECAEVLKKNGAKEVFAVVIARQEIKEK
jgi:ComF family protein